MGYEREAVDELFATVAAGRSQMQTRLMRAGKGEPFVLRYLQRHGTCTPSRLAAALRASSGRVSALLTVLERKGFVTRGMDPSDRRTVLVNLTDAGREEVERGYEEMRSSICWIFRQMGERRTREFVDLTKEFSTYMSLCRPGEPRPTPEEVAAAFGNTPK
ncbi:MarR family winged helix-turn-helix transcriptional regulator [uncultured Bifidobacterium sp.]|uniref:MarR family winged helix-turn-helix transcriptional regulator n=1 Tax=uncultured Bifidobacterium sp. TaxID=165187 RepID=UPI00261E4B76|nr:MarR family winged helix-turn-helix transcriptional regulator [uncultured Bifidobacterium sp.]